MCVYQAPVKRQALSTAFPASLHRFPGSADRSRCCCSISVPSGRSHGVGVVLGLSVQGLALLFRAALRSFRKWPSQPRGSAPHPSVVLFSWLGEVTAVARLCCRKVAALSRDSRDLSVPRKASDGVRHEGEEIRIGRTFSCFPVSFVILFSTFGSALRRFRLCAAERASAFRLRVDAAAAALPAWAHVPPSHPLPRSALCRRPRWPTS